ncbi:MAG: VTT domain-containing protein [Elusimicrobia bacterium]|nr:VTT domain-containing protein [Elusimicrobiota bacterium]
MLSNLLAAHGATSSFLWGFLKTMVPLPSPSGFALMGAEVARPSSGVAPTAVRLLARVVIPGSAGVCLGATPYYLWARRSGREAVKRWGPRIGIPRHRIETLERRAEKRRGLLVWTLFALPVSPTALAAAAAGLMELDPGRCALLAMTGVVLRISILASIGWAFRFSFGDPIRLFRPEELIVVAAALAAAGWLMRRRMNRPR